MAMKKRRMQAPKMAGEEMGINGGNHKVSPPEAWNCIMLKTIVVRSEVVIVELAMLESIPLMSMSITLISAI